MLTLQGRKLNCCDGIPRRAFLKVGFLGLGALGLPSILRAREEAARLGQEMRRRSVIYIELAGGPSQFETYDPKPEAPLGIRGEFGVVKTNVPGVWFSELMVEQAKVMDKLAIVRSIHHNNNAHEPSSHLVHTGYYKRGPKGAPNEAPAIGSVVARLRGPNQKGLPAYVAVPSVVRNGRASYAGSHNNPFEVIGDPNDLQFQVRDVAPRVSVDRLDDRRGLLKFLDDSRRLFDLGGVADALDKYNQDAFDLITGQRARAAFDLQLEEESLRDDYGRTKVGQSMLLARRLVEAGVTFVTVRVTGWDDHDNLVAKFKKRGPVYDQALAALVRDLNHRGLDRDVLVVAMGEFGRSPRFDSKSGGGRGHWGSLMSVLFAGGGMQVGQVVGASNRHGEVPIDAPYRPENVLATVYHHLQIDPATTLSDFNGRPRHLLDHRQIIKELI